jgi:hypothetical protein
VHRNVIFRPMTLTIQTHSFTPLDPGTQLWFIFAEPPISLAVHGRSLRLKTTKRLVPGSDAGLATTVFREAIEKAWRSPTHTTVTHATRYVESRSSQCERRKHFSLRRGGQSLPWIRPLMAVSMRPLQTQLHSLIFSMKDEL